MRTPSLGQGGFVWTHCRCLCQGPWGPLGPHFTKTRTKLGTSDSGLSMYLWLGILFCISQSNLFICLSWHTSLSLKRSSYLSLCSLKPSTEHQPGTSHGWNMVLKDNPVFPWPLAASHCSWGYQGLPFSYFSWPGRTFPRVACHLIYVRILHSSNISRKINRLL